MTKALTDEFISETYQGVIHSQGTELSGTGGDGEVTMLYDGAGNETSIAVGRKGSGVAIYCNLSACGSIFINGTDLLDIIDNRNFWSYVPESQAIENKTLTFAGSTVNTVIINSTLSAMGDVIAYYSSDVNLKTDFSAVDINIDDITPYKFKWTEAIGDARANTWDYGVKAQEVQEVAPILVKENNKGYLSVDYIKFIPILINEVKSLKDEVTRLRDLVTSLEYIL
jgi:hypothetical protein